MSRTLRHLALFLAAFLCSARLASAQVVTGTPPFGSFRGDPDVIDLANLNAHWTVPIRHKPGRGTDFTYDLSYDSSVWHPVGASGNQFWQPVNNWGWISQSGIATGYVTVQLQDSAYCTDQTTGQDWVTYELWGGWTYYDPFGVPHAFNGTTEFRATNTTCPPSKGTTTSLTTTATDGSGYVLSAFGGTLRSVISSGGRVYNPPVNTTAGAANLADRNGNQISVDISGNFTDTLGTTALAVSGVAPGNTTFSYTSPSGALVAYTMKYSTYTIQTKFGCSGITEFGANGTTTASLVSEIDLPDYNVTTNPNSRYTFTYETTLGGTSGAVTGRLKAVTLPTGGTITYNYLGGDSSHNGITCADGSAYGLQRSTPDTGSNYWEYDRTPGTGAAYTTAVTDPQGNQTVIQFQGIYETQRKVYQGSTSGTLLRTWNTCYNGSAPPCTGTAITLPISQRTVIDQYGSSGLQCKHNYIYNDVGGLTEQDDYDYGAGGPGPLLRKTLVTFAPLGNITAFRQTVTVCNASGTNSSCNGTGTPVAQTNYNYDETALVTPTNLPTPQHTSVTGSRGNLTSINYPVSGLTARSTYYDTGNVNTSTDVNGGVTTYTYSSLAATCGNAFPMGVTEAISILTQSMTWNCTGGVQLTATDENANTTTTVYANDPYFWRPDSVADPTGATVSYCYGLLSSSTGTCTRNPTQVESTLNFNSNNSSVDSLVTLDSLGRPHIRQNRQFPSLTTFDSAESDYDALGRSSRGTLPYSGNAGQTNSTAPAVITTYEALGRPFTVTDAGNGTVTYTYNQNDVLVAIGPAPAGENTKQRQLEYDSLGRLTSVCEITNATQSGSCGQNSSATGYLTKYTFDALGNLTGVTQNAQPNGTAQTRTYVYDAMSRLTSETNRESGTSSYTYDSASGCSGAFNGDLVKRVDAVGNTSCYTYDALHRKLRVTYLSGSYASVTPSKYFVYDAATVNGVAMTNAKTRLADAYTCAGSCTTKLTDIGFSYTARGEVSDVYESTPHSSPSYYHVAQAYWSHGAPYQSTSNITGLPTITYGGTIGSTVGLDGEGRITQVTASGAGQQQNPVTGVTYNNSSLPTQVTYGSADSDIFGYDSHTLRMNSYQFNVGFQSVIGTSGWNANGSLGTLAISDPFNPANTQNCSYAADDLSRIAKADCGAIRGQTFSYDPFGNISKNKLSGSNTTSFTPTYQTSPVTNRVASVSGVSATYDANGNSTFDTFRTYTWDADGNPVTIGSATLTYDALDRMVEQTAGSSNSEIVYGPGGGKLALMSGTSLIKAFVPLTGGATAVYTSGGLAYYRHTDQLGTSRLASTPSRTVYSDTAYSAFGEPYAQSGALDPSFTGQNQDTTAGLYDFLFREQDPNQGRWSSPDPAGLAAVEPSNPQSWNRYAYVLNSPVNLLDPLGLTVCDANGTNCYDRVMVYGGGSGFFGGGWVGWGRWGHTWQILDGAPGKGAAAADGGNTSGGNNAPQTPWYKTCTAKAIGNGLLHVGIDAIGLIPEGGLVSRAVGNYAGYRGIVATQQGTKALQAGKLGTGIGFAGVGSDDTSTTGFISTGLGVAGIAATLASATPVVGQVISGLSILNDSYSAWKEVVNCN